MDLAPLRIPDAAREIERAAYLGDDPFHLFKAVKGRKVPHGGCAAVPDAMNWPFDIE